MRLSLAPFKGLVTSNHSRSSAAFITLMSERNFSDTKPQAGLIEGEAPIVDLILHQVLGMAVALLNLAFELFALAFIWAKSSSVSLPHYSLTLPANCFQLPSMNSQIHDLTPSACGRAATAVNHRLPRLNRQPGKPRQEQLPAGRGCAPPQWHLLTGVLVTFNRVLMSLLAMLVRGRRVLFGLFVLVLTVLVGCLKVVMSGSSVVCSSGMMMFDCRMFCHCHDR
jgi:hypothetical protein